MTGQFTFSRHGHLPTGRALSPDVYRASGIRRGHFTDEERAAFASAFLARPDASRSEMCRVFFRLTGKDLSLMTAAKWMKQAGQSV